MKALSSRRCSAVARHLGLATALLLLGAPQADPLASAPPRVPVAVTVDDLPWAGPSSGAAERLTGNEAMLAALAARGVEATGFVNCERHGADTTVLRAWLAGGHRLGNHSATHLALDRAGAAAWLDDVARCDRFLAELIDEPVRYIRYPMLRQGATTARRDSAAAGLARMGYRNAHVTIDNSEYLVADAYRRAAAAGDSGKMQRLAELYVDHMRAAFAHARAVARRKAGREVAHVLLIHANLLNADRLGALLDGLASDGAEFVPLEFALRDPVYSRRDEYAGPRGLSWLYRIAPLDDADAGWDATEAARVEAALRQDSGERE